jgi:small subunit ribosomal protein S6
MQDYEIAILYKPDLESDLKASETKVTKIITSTGGEITSTDNWGKKKLAYDIKKQQSAVYVFYVVKMPTEGVKKVNDILNITEEVLRFLITKIDHKKIAKFEAEKADKAKKQVERDAINEAKEDK